MISDARIALGAMFLVACSSSSSTPSNAVDAGSDVATDTTQSGCALAASTTAVSTFRGCALLTRDTSACKDARVAAGLSGFWLKFSCRVTLAVSSGTVTITTDSRPDYPSEYFPKTDACYAPESGATPNPNGIAAQNVELSVPLSASSSTSEAMKGGAVGVAVNGVVVFDNQAAPGDDIYQEIATFDACQGHPQMTGVYHYHSEPYAISLDDAAFIGVMRDGYPIYGRKDADGSTPTLDASGGHTGTTPDSATPVFHYHANEQTSTSPTSAGETAWFLTTGTYHGAPGSCSGC